MNKINLGKARDLQLDLTIAQQDMNNIDELSCNNKVSMIVRFNKNVITK